VPLGIFQDILNFIFVNAPFIKPLLSMVAVFYPLYHILI